MSGQQIEQSCLNLGSEGYRLQYGFPPCHVYMGLSEHGGIIIIITTTNICAASDSLPSNISNLQVKQMSFRE